MNKPSAHELYTTLCQRLLPEQTLRDSVNDNVRMLVLSQGVFEDGGEYYAYLSLTPDRYLYLLAHEEAGEGGYSLGELGDILYYGEGNTPPDEVQQIMEKELAINPNYARDFDELLALIKKLDDELPRHPPTD